MCTFLCMCAKLGLFVRISVSTCTAHSVQAFKFLLKHCTLQALVWAKGICVCVCVCVCARAYMCVCVRACARAQRFCAEQVAILKCSPLFGPAWYGLRAPLHFFGRWLHPPHPEVLARTSVRLAPRHGAAQRSGPP